MKRLLLLLTLAALAAGATTANAATTSCLPSSTPVFAQFGDPANYFLAPGGGFEAGTAAWTFSANAKVVAGNETYNIGGAGTSSLSLPKGSTATSPSFCVDPTAPTMRFLLRNTANTDSKIALDVTYTKLDGNPRTDQIATFTGQATWQPSPIVAYLTSAITKTLIDGSTNVKFRFRPLDDKGAWQIDDVYIDPYKRCC